MTYTGKDQLYDGNGNTRTQTDTKSRSETNSIESGIIFNTNPGPKDSSFIGPMMGNLINDFIDEFKKKKYKDKIIKNAIDPVLSDIENRYYPYFMALVMLLVLIVILLLSLLIVHTKCCYSSSKLTTTASTI